MPVALPTDHLVTRLPYLGERRALKFDRLQWPTNRKPGKFAKQLGDAGLNFSEYAHNFHQLRYATANDMRMQYTPRFAADDKLVRLVLAQQCWLYAMTSLEGITTIREKRIPDSYLNNKGAFDDLMARAEAAQRTFDYSTNPLSWRNHQSHLQAIDRHGNYLNVRALVQHRAWRLYQNGSEIGIEMGIKWHDIRQILQRLVIVATRLGLETYPKHHSFRHEIPADLVRQEEQIAA